MDDYLDQGTFSDFIIAILSSSRSTFIMRKVLRERIKARNKFKNANLSQTLKRLESKGFLNMEKDKINFSFSKLKNYKYIGFIKTKPKKDKKIIIIFDIPENDRRVRDWLRGQIKIWGFKMIQKSVWLGDGPLPKEFDQKIKYLGIDKNIRIFNVQSSTK